MTGTVKILFGGLTVTEFEEILFKNGDNIDKEREYLNESANKIIDYESKHKYDHEKYFHIPEFYL